MALPGLNLRLGLLACYSLGEIKGKPVKGCLVEDWGVGMHVLLSLLSLLVSLKQTNSPGVNDESQAETNADSWQPNSGLDLDAPCGFPFGIQMLAREKKHLHSFERLRG